jgi:hypothetical protein
LREILTGTAIGSGTPRTDGEFILTDTLFLLPKGELRLEGILRCEDKLPLDWKLKLKGVEFATAGNRALLGVGLEIVSSPGDMALPFVVERAAEWNVGLILSGGV